MIHEYLLAFLSILSGGSERHTPPQPQPMNVLVPLIVQQTPEPPAEAKLEVEGGNVQVVKVDRVIIVKEDRTVVQTPFKIKAPLGFAFYSWQTPDGSKWLKKGNVLEVTSCPKGTQTFVVEMLSGKVVNGDVIFTTTFGSMMFDIGAVTPVTPPVGPPVTPVDPPVTPIDLGPDTMGFAKLAKAEGDKVTAAYKTKAAELANNFEAVSAKLAATASMTVDDAIKDLTTKNRATLPDDASKLAWMGFFNGWTTLANAHNADGSLTTKPGYVDALADTAKGLRAVR